MSDRRDWALAGGILLAAVVVVVAMVALRPEVPPRAVPSRVPVVTVVAAEPGHGAIGVLASGSVRPRAEIEVAAEVAGKVAWVNPAFRSGGRVREGDALFRVDDADYRNRVRQARANVAAQQVALLRAEEEARVARMEYERFRQRRGEGADVVATPLALHQPQMEAARAALARDSAALASAELALARTHVRAPFDAFVRSESVDEGRFVAIGQGVGRLYAEDAYEVALALTDADAALLPGLWRMGAGARRDRTPAEVVARYGSARYAWSGYVDRAETALSERTRAITVVVRVPRPFSPGTRVGAVPGALFEVDGEPEAGDAERGAAGPPLLVGQFVDVRIDGVAPERWWAMPRRALRAGDEVWALADDSTLTIVPVRVLQHAEEMVYLTGELPPGHRVVTEGIAVATEGMRVSVSVGSGDLPAPAVVR